MTDQKDKIVIVSIIIIVFLFLFLSRTITSGYHFVDDHEVIKMKYDLSISSLSDVTKKWVMEDIVSTLRFRPLYYIHRVYETRLFGSDFFIWSFYTGILCCISMIFFYLGMRNLKFSLVESIVFLIISFIGPQSAIWWRLGPAETLGVVFFGLSFYFLSRSATKKNYHLNTLFFIFFLILSSLTKESFLIIIPAMVFFKVWIEKNSIWSSLRESVNKNILLIVPLIVLIIELFIIKLKGGTDLTGLDSDLLKSLKGLFSVFIRFIRTYLNLIIVVLIMTILYYRLKKSFLKLNRFSIIFFLLILIPNISLFGRSGLVERYLLPTSIGLGYLFVSFIRGMDEKPGWFRKLASALVIISFIPFTVTSVADATDFSKEGISTKKLLSAISSNYKSGSQVLVIVDPVQEYERSVSLKTYLYYENNIDLFGHALIKNDDAINYPDYIGGWKSYFAEKQLENMTTKPGLLIFLDNKMIDEFFKSSTLPRNEYVPVEVGVSQFALLKEE